MDEAKTRLKKLMAHMVLEHDISVIPLKFDDKGYGKRPFMKGWEKYCDERPSVEEIQEWTLPNDISGIGVTCGRASNIGCLDIDTFDKSLQEKIWAIIPDGTPWIKGHPDKLGKFLFRLTERDGDSPQGVGVERIKDGSKKTQADIFWSGGQVVVPPSMYTKSGKIYTWNHEGASSDPYYFPNKETMPILHKYIVDNLRRIIENKDSLEEIEMTSPAGSVRLGLNLGENSGKWDDMNSFIAGLVRSRIGADEAVKRIVAHDIHRNGADNLALLEKSNASPDPYFNAHKWFHDILSNMNKGKKLPEMVTPDVWKSDVGLDIPVEYVGWDRPILPAPMADVGKFDIGMVPPVWSDLVNDISTSINVPAEAVFMLKLTQLGSVIGNKLWIRPKKKMLEWKEAHNIYTCYVSKSGTRKTPMLKIASEPIKRLQKRVDDDYNKKLATHEKLMRMLEPQIKETEFRIKQESISIMDGGSTDSSYLDKMQEDLEVLQAQVNPPRRRQLTVNAATPEKMLDIIEVNNTGTLVVYNELSELIAKFKKTGYEALRTIIMDAWDGYQSYTYQTKHSGDVKIEKMCLGLYASVQPSVFEQELYDIYRGKNDDGLWQRFNYVINDYSMPNQDTDTAFRHESHYDAYEIYQRAYDIPENDGVVTFSHQALKALMGYTTKMSRMAQKDPVDARSSMWSKMQGKLVSIASLVQFLLNNGKELREVSMEAFNIAKYIMERQELYIANMFPNESVRGLSRVVADMQSGVIQSGVKLSAIQRTYRQYIPTVKAREALLRELVERNIVKTIKSHGATILEISPYVF